MSAVLDFERERLNKNIDIQVKGLLISNAEGFWDESTKNYAAEKNVRFVKATLPRNWSRKARWKIRNLEEMD